MRTRHRLALLGAAQCLFAGCLLGACHAFTEIAADGASPALCGLALILAMASGLFAGAALLLAWHSGGEG